MNTIFGATFVGHWFEEVFCSLRSHGTRDKAGSIIDRCYRERLAWKCYRRVVRGKMFAGKCLWGNVLFASLTRHTLRLWALTRPSAQPTVPGQGKGEGRAITYERLFICQTHVERLQSLIFATNGKIGRFEFAP